MNFTTAVIFRVNDLQGSVSFFNDVLGFKQHMLTEDGMLLENGALTIRLVQIAEALNPEDSLNLELQTSEIAKTTADLLAHSGVYVIDECVQISQKRCESHLQGPHGIIITLAQEFNEDDLGILPPLPISLEWQENAEACVKKVLRQVPIGFREAARTRITERAEMLAGEEGLITVSVDQAVKSLAQVTPIFQHPAIEIALKQQGIDPGDLFQQNPAS